MLFPDTVVDPQIMRLVIDVKGPSFHEMHFTVLSLVAGAGEMKQALETRGRLWLPKLLWPGNFKVHFLPRRLEKGHFVQGKPCGGAGNSGCLPRMPGRLLCVGLPGAAVRFQLFPFSNFFFPALFFSFASRACWGCGECENSRRNLILASLQSAPEHCH